MNNRIGNYAILPTLGKLRFTSNHLLYLSLIIFFMFPAEVTSLESIINFHFPKPSGLWYGIYKQGLSTSYINFVELVIFFILVSIILKKLIENKISIKIDRIVIVTFWFYMVSFISLLGSYNVTYADNLNVFPLDGIVNLAKALVLYVILLQLSDNGFMEKLYTILLHIGLVLALISIIAYFVFGYFTYQERYLGWRVNVLGMGVNTGAIFLSCIAMIAYNMKKKIYIIYFILIVLTILLTGSRQAFFSLLIAIMVYHILNSKKQGIFNLRSIGITLFIIIIIITLTSSYVLSILYNISGFTLFVRLQNLGELQSDLSAFSRIFIWYNYMQLMMKHLFFGLGNSDWLIEILGRSYTYPYPVPHSHNILLQTFIKGGLVSSIPLVWVILSTEYSALKSSFNKIAGIVLLPIIVSGIFGYGFWNMKLMYLFTILLFCAGYNNRSNPMYTLSVS